MTVRVAAVIGNYEGAEHLPECLESLGAQTLQLVQTVVVDAGSHDESMAIARARDATVVNAQNRGLGYLYNRGAESVDADFVFFANNDLALQPTCIEHLAQALAESDDRFAADPMQLDWTGVHVIHARTVLRRGPLVRTPIPGLVVDPLFEVESTTTTVCANAGAMLVRLSMFRDLGGFDETFFLDFEDLELCWRAWARGWPSVYVPTAQLRHKVGMSASPTVSPRRLRSSHHNLIRFALTCLPSAAAARVLATEIARLPRAPRAIGPALLQVAREGSEIARKRLPATVRRAVLTQLLER